MLLIFLELRGKLMKKNLIPFVLSTLAAVTVLASCNGGNGSGLKKLYVSTYNNADPNMSNLWKPGYDANAERFGFESHWDDAANDDNKGLQNFKAAVTSNSYDAYALNLVSQTNGANYLNEIKKVNVPVVFWNRELAKSNGDIDVDLMKSYKNAYYVGIESAEGGRYEGRAIAEHILKNGGVTKFDRNSDGKVGVYVVKGEDGHADAEARCVWAPIYLDAFLAGMTTDAEIMEAYKPTGNLTGVNVPGVTFKKIEIIGCQTAKNTAGATWDPNTAATQVNNVLTGDNGTKVDVVLSNNDGMAVQIAKSKTFIDSKALIAGIDALPDAISQLKTNGSQYVASIRNDGKLQSKVVLQALKNMIDGKDITADMDKIDEFDKVVTTKAEWLADANSLWYDSEHKAFRVHHVILTPSNVNELA